MLTAPFPSKYESDPFGSWPDWRKNMGLGPHRGKDWNGLPAGTPIPASGTGRVTWKTNLRDPESTELGHRIVVGYDLGDGRTLYVGYCHLDETSPLDVGDPIRLGNTVGFLGNSGSASTGAHLHQTASWENGNPGTVPVIDVMQFFRTTTTAGGTGTPIEEDDMFTEEDRARLNAVYAALFGPKNLNPSGEAQPLKWLNNDGSAQSTNYGVLPIILHNQDLIAKAPAKTAAAVKAQK